MNKTKARLKSKLTQCEKQNRKMWHDICNNWFTPTSTENWITLCVNVNGSKVIVTKDLKPTKAPEDIVAYVEEEEVLKVFKASRIGYDARMNRGCSPKSYQWINSWKEMLYKKIVDGFSRELRKIMFGESENENR